MQMIAESLRKLEAGHGLTREEAEAAMEELLAGRLAHREIVRLLTSLRDKGETVDELVGFARAMRRHAVQIFPEAPIPTSREHSAPGQRKETLGRSAADLRWQTTDSLPQSLSENRSIPLVPGWRADSPLVDTCGTGGDGGGTFNVSTAAAFVAAGAGARVAKHGNRSYSSRTGSADVLEALGLKLDMPAARAAEAIETIGIVFLFAPVMHTAMRHAVAARREVGGRTV